MIRALARLGETQDTSQTQSVETTTLESDLKNNYDVKVKNWEPLLSSEGHQSYKELIDPRTGELIRSWWVKLNLSIANYNQDESLDQLTIQPYCLRVSNDQRPYFYVLKKVTIAVKDIPPKKSDTIILQYPVDFYTINSVKEFYVAIKEDDLPERVIYSKD